MQQKADGTAISANGAVSHNGLYTSPLAVHTRTAKQAVSELRGSRIHAPCWPLGSRVSSIELTHVTARRQSMSQYTILLTHGSSGLGA